jgi:hypothetical protein
MDLLDQLNYMWRYVATTAPAAWYVYSFALSTYV